MKFQQDNAPAHRARQTVEHWSCFVMKLEFTAADVAAQQPGPQSGCITQLGSDAQERVHHKPSQHVADPQQRLMSSRRNS